MIGNSVIEYVWVVTWVIILHSIGPLCITYSILATCLPAVVPWPKCFGWWALAESIFYLLTFVYQHHLQRPALHPPPLRKEERKQLFNTCQNTTEDHARYVEKWFLDAPLAAIKRENIKEFFRWAFLNTAMDDPEYDDEMEEYVETLERNLGTKFEPGRADVTCLRLTVDKVDALHRSLTWYMVRMLFDQVAARLNNANKGLRIVYLRG